jgi:glycerol-3-phosphate cytidylyltransferase-like family protein
MPNRAISFFPSQMTINRDLSINIYWENLDDKYPINPSYKYCVFINGCFCPPHKGHINSVRKAIEIFGPNTKIIINQIGSTSRHGVPKDFNKYMMETYINTVFKSNPNIKLLFRARNKEIFLNDFVLNSDVLVIIRGDETDEDDRDDEHCLQEINSTYKKKFKKISKYLGKKKHIKLDILFQFRPHNKVSATRFIQLLNIYKKKYNNGYDCIEDMFELYYMMPEELDLETKYSIIKKLITFNTYTKKLLTKTNTKYIDNHAHKQMF